MGHALVLEDLVGRIAILVGVSKRSMTVLMRVVIRLVLELAQDTSAMEVGHMPVPMEVDPGGVSVRAAELSDAPAFHLCLVVDPDSGGPSAINTPDHGCMVGPVRTATFQPQVAIHHKPITGGDRPSRPTLRGALA